MPFHQSLVIGLLVALASSVTATADPAEIHYAPIENLEQVDVALLQSARSKISLAAYSLTNWPVIDALINARRRGVVIRIVLDPSQQHALDRLREISDVLRMKAPGPYMHLKSYSIDGRLLRSGSANLTASGLKQQDNDIVIIREASAARAFDARFEEIWLAAKPIKPVNPIAVSPAHGSTLANAATTPSSGCAIKGNVNREGERIFHMPGTRNYERVRMNIGTGKRWFCSEDQAVAAGWRPAEVK
jgi:phosphatidylserine/phosphatidylglycerophosphate/cardiolipin synthase-like enzyme